MSDIWFVRAGRDAVYAEDFLQRKVVGIGWDELGPLDFDVSKAEILDLYKKSHPDHPDGKAQVAVSQIFRFMHEIKVGDEVMTFDRDKQMYYLGKITSESKWKPDGTVDFARIRDVEWTGQISRTLLSTDAKNMLGAILTLFLVKGKPAVEVITKSTPIQLAAGKVSDTPAIKPIAPADSRVLESEIRAELLEKAEQAIEDRILRLDWEQVQELVAGVLRAMGYRTTVSPRGSDRGVDIFASKDGLGLEEPRIFVEVKHRPATAISSEGIRSFLGGRTTGVISRTILSQCSRSIQSHPFAGYAEPRVRARY